MSITPLNQYHTSHALIWRIDNRIKISLQTQGGNRARSSAQAVFLVTIKDPE